MGAGATTLVSYLKFRGGVSGGWRGLWGEDTSGVATGCETRKIVGKDLLIHPVTCKGGF